jgi:hypothetical protein
MSRSPWMTRQRSVVRAHCPVVSSRGVLDASPFLKCRSRQPEGATRSRLLTAQGVACPRIGKVATDRRVGPTGSCLVSGEVTVAPRSGRPVVQRHALATDFVPPCIPTRAVKPPPDPAGSTRSSMTATGFRSAGTATPFACSRGAATTGVDGIWQSSRPRRSPRGVVHARWRRSRLRPGWDRNLRRATSPRHRQRGDAVRVRSARADGQHLRGLPLGDRKKRPARLAGKRRPAIVLSDHPTRTAPRSSRGPVRWASKASFQATERKTGQGVPGLDQD